MAYAVQFLFYSIGCWLMLGSYLLCIAEHRQQKIFYRILMAFGLLYAAGVIVSIWTGPFYPHQVLWYKRMIYGFVIPRGVGFAEGTNMAGAVLLIFSALIGFQYEGKGRVIVLLIVLTGLCFTYSRAAIISFIVSVLGLWLCEGFFSVLKGRFEYKMLFKPATLCCGLVAVYLIGSYIIPPHTKLKAIAVSFGISGASATSSAIKADRTDPVKADRTGPVKGGRTGNNLVKQVKAGRYKYWEAALTSYLEEVPLKKVFGRGFRQSSIISEYGAWETPHNMYLALLLDFGLAGLAIFMMPFLVYFVQVAKMMATGSNRLNRGCSVAVMGLLLMNLTEAYFYSPVLIILLLLLFELHQCTTNNQRYNAEEHMALNV